MNVAPATTTAAAIQKPRPPLLRIVELILSEVPPVEVAADPLTTRSGSLSLRRGAAGEGTASSS